MTTSSVIQPASFFDLVAFEQPGFSWWKIGFQHLLILLCVNARLLGVGTMKIREGFAFAALLPHLIAEIGN
jgi:hypothetical protein